MPPNMGIAGAIFDVDGTLVDTNGAHIDAWVDAFAARGYVIPRDRIAAEVGQGGERLVRSILGAGVTTAAAAELRELCLAAYDRRAPARTIPVFPMVGALFAELARRDVRTALATSSTRRQLDLLGRHVSLDLTALADVVVTADDVRVSKPAPDTVRVAVERLGLVADRCIYVGDTPFDALAATAAGVRAYGVLTGGFAAPALIHAGARGVWPDVAALLADLDHIL
jgi:HAD superfamily hydrolase (TIGR01509 family)